MTEDPESDEDDDIIWLPARTKYFASQWMSGNGLALDEVMANLRKLIAAGEI